MKKRIAFSWSGGKDSALALYFLLNDDWYEVVCLISNFNANGKLNMHAVPSQLIQKQAQQIGLPLKEVHVKDNDNKSYENAMRATLLELKSEGVEGVAFGDIFLENLKEYRTNKLNEVGMDAIFPLWSKDPHELIDLFLKFGFKTLTCCVNEDLLGERFLNRLLNEEFFEELPDHVDVCGENGEYHSFCFDGPIFKNPVHFEMAESWTKDYEFELDDGSLMQSTYRYSSLIS